MGKPIKILIIGNGFGGTYALKNLHKYFHNNKNVELSIIGDKNYFLFTPLLHEVATGGINPENIIEPIRKVLKCCLNNFYLGTAEMIDLENRTVKVGNLLVAYDYLVLAPGAETNFFNIEGAEENSFTLKSIDDALKIKNHCVTQMELATHEQDEEKRKNMLRFVVVGGGPSGIEFATELQELIRKSFNSYYSAKIINDASVILIQRDKELIPQFGEKMRIKSLKVLGKKGVKVMLNTAVKKISAESVTLSDETEISTESVLWVAGIKPAELNFSKELLKSPGGKLVVNECLQLKEHKEIFAIGDIASFVEPKSGKELPALAQVAEKEAKHIAENIALLIKNKTPKPFFYKHAGNLMSLGQWMAVGEISHFTFSGHITWWLWRTVYLSKLISWRKKIRVAIDWTIDIFSPRDISQI